MSKPLLLDLFCGAGGASVGYHRAGFVVVGVDIAPQPHYPFEFHQLDAVELLGRLSRRCAVGAAAIHASPTCQHQANVTAWRGNRASHPDNLTPTLEALSRISIPWVVENVPEALPTWDYILCGSHFGLKVKRHRGFRRGNWKPADMDLLPPCHHRGLLPFMHKAERAYTDALGCHWMNRDEGRQAIPPAYTEYIGRQLLEALAVASP
jgi:hypothetical protein